MIDTKSLPAILLQEKQGRSLWHLGALLTFKALGEETNNQFWALEGLADRNMAVPLHSHSHEDEMWFVLEGEIRFIIGDETQIGTPGTFAYIPRHVPHTFQILSPTARWFGVGTPAGLDQWFFETGEPAQSLTLPPPPAAPPNVEMIVASLKRYGTDTLDRRRAWVNRYSRKSALYRRFLFINYPCIFNTFITRTKNNWQHVSI